MYGIGRKRLHVGSDWEQSAGYVCAVAARLIGLAGDSRAGTLPDAVCQGRLAAVKRAGCEEFETLRWAVSSRVSLAGLLTRWR